MEKNKDSARVITGVDTRWNYVNAWEAKAYQGSVPRFSVSLIIPKSDLETMKMIFAAIHAAYEEGKKKLEVEESEDERYLSYSHLKMPVHDGDLEKSENKEYENCYFINAYSLAAPGIVDSECRQITEHSEVYSGVYGRASIHFYAFNKNGFRGIACGLDNLQKIRDGEPLGRRTPEKDFANY